MQLDLIEIGHRGLSSDALTDGRKISDRTLAKREIVAALVDRSWSGLGLNSHLVLGLITRRGC